MDSKEMLDMIEKVNNEQEFDRVVDIYNHAEFNCVEHHFIQMFLDQKYNQIKGARQ